MALQVNPVPVPAGHLDHGLNTLPHADHRASFSFCRFWVSFAFSLTITRLPPEWLADQSFAGVTDSMRSNRFCSFNLSYMADHAQSTSRFNSHFLFAEPPHGPFNMLFAHLAIGQMPPVVWMMQFPQPTQFSDHTLWS